MSFLPRLFLPRHQTAGLCVILMSAFLPLAACSLAAQDTQLAEPANALPDGDGEQYVPAVDLLPKNTAGLLRIPNFPKFIDAWEKTHIGMLADEPSMQPFLETQKKRAKKFLNSVDKNAIGVRPENLYEIASGEVVGAWLPFEKDQRRPFAVCLIVDVRGLRDKADKVLVQIDKDLKAGGATRKDVEYRGETISVYSTKPKPGQLKIDEVAITLSDERIIAADRDTVVQDLLDAVAGKAIGEPLSKLGTFRQVLDVSRKAINEPAEKDGQTIAIEWFAKPFQMGRIVREVFEVDRGNDVDILKLLESQGFDAVKSLGGVFAMAGERFDFLHRGFIYAPMADDKKFSKAARMLDFPNEPLAQIPAWVHPESGTFNRMNWKLEDAFWASETLINEAFGDEIFRPMIEGIKEDEEGPQIDLETQFFPFLADQLILVTDNKMPVDLDSDRMLVAVRIKDAEKIKKAVQKAMEVEPDATKLDVLPGVDIWRVQRGESEDDFEAELLELGLEPEEGAEDEPPPLLHHWAIAVVDKGPGSDVPYLLFSSHPDLLIMAATRIRQGAKDGLAKVDSVKKIVEVQKELGAKGVAFDRVTRLRYSLRVKYELLRQGKLKDSDSILSSILRRVAEDEEGGEEDPLNAKALPPIAKIEQHLRDGGSFYETTKDGWLINGFFLR